MDFYLRNALLFTVHFYYVEISLPIIFSSLLSGQYFFAIDLDERLICFTDNSDSF